MKRKIITVVSLVAGAFLSEMVFNYFLSKQMTYGVISFLVLGCLGFGIFLKKIQKASLFQVLSFFLVCALFGIYILYTMLNPAFRNSGIFDLLKLNDGQITGPFGFLAIFSLVYGLSQPIGGYLLGKFKLKGYVVAMILVSLALLLQSFTTSSTLFLGSRIAAGAFFSVAGIVISFYPVTFWEKSKLNLVINSIIFIALKSADISNNIISAKVAENPMLMQPVIKYLSITIFTLSVIFLVFISTKKDNKVEVQKTEQNALQDFLNIVKKDSSAAILFFTQATSCILFYSFRISGCLSDFSKISFPSLDPSNSTNIMNSVSSYAIIMAAILLNLMSLKGLILVALGIQAVSLAIFLAFGATYSSALSVMAIGASIGWIVQSFIPMIFGEKYGDRPSIGLIFGLLNISAMFVGGYLFPVLAMNITSKYGMMKSMVILAPLVIASFASMLYVYRKK